MRRSRLFRASAGLLGLWVAVFVGGTGAVRFCPMQGGLHEMDGMQMPMGASMPTFMGGSTNAAMHMATDGSTSAPDKAPAGGGSADCSCRGACCAPADVVAPTAAEVLLATIVVRHVPRAFAALSLDRPTAPQHARPPTVGPPTLLV
jgi:hypothetical protein